MITQTARFRLNKFNLEIPFLPVRTHPAPPRHGNAKHDRIAEIRRYGNPAGESNEAALSGRAGRKAISSTGGAIEFPFSHR